MKLGLWLWPFVLMMAPSVRAEGREGTLIWNNGESLKGRLAVSDQDTLGWQAELFQEPLALHLAPLRRVEFSGQDEMTKEPLAIFLADGSRLHGDIVSMDGETLTFHSERHGTVAVKRAEVMRIQRMTGAGLVYGGPCGAARWTAVSDPSGQNGLPADPPRTGRGGVLLAPGWNHRVALNLPLPERMDIAFRLSSTEQLAFGLELVGGDSTLALQTWGDEVVLLWGSRFVSLSRLAASDRAVSLRVLWDRKEKRCAVFSGDGSRMCEWQSEPVKPGAPKNDGAPAQAKDAATGENPLVLMAKALISLASGDPNKAVTGGKPGLILQNRGRDLVVERMSVREWSGKEPQHVDANSPFVSLADGSAVQGGITRIANGTVFVKPAQGDEKSVPLDQVDAAQLSAISPKETPPGQVDLWTADGSLITGKLLGVRDDGVRVQTSFAREPMACQTSAITRIDLDVPPPENTPEEPPLGRMDRLVWATTTLHGTWSTLGDTAMHWLPVGAVKPVSVTLSRNVEITRAIPPDAVPPASAALFHLSNGDILPGMMTSMDEENVGIDAPLLGIKQIPSVLLRAVQFPGVVESKGFKDKAWVLMRGNSKDLERSDSKITLQPGTSFGHPLMLQADEVRFSVAGGQNSFTSLRVRLFTNGSGGTKSETKIIIGHYSNRIYAGLEQEENQFSNRCQVNINSNQAAMIRLVPHAKDVEIFINGASMLKVPSDAAKRSGAGLIFEPCSLWGNGEYPAVVGDFLAVSNPGRAWLPGVDAAARTQALLIPRFRKDTPPRHMLIAANGDLLRGELLAGTGTHFAFRVGLDTFQIPRERVTTAVWLQKPPPEKKTEGKGEGTISDAKAVAKDQTKAAEPVAEAAEKPTHWLQLVAGARFALTVEKMDGDAVLGRSALLGHCRIPLSSVYKIRNTAPGPDLTTRAFDGWKLEFAPEPEISGAGDSSSPLLSKEAPDFSLPLLAGDKFQLRSQMGKVVVLDFWATWCAPCVRSMPDMIEALSAFPADQVQFVGVNRGESKEQVKRFLEQRGWKVSVALDSQEKVSLQYGVDGIPHTVVIGPDGKVAWTNTGDNSAGLVGDVVKKLLRGKK